MNAVMSPSYWIETPKSVSTSPEAVSILVIRSGSASPLVKKAPFTCLDRTLTLIYSRGTWGKLTRF